MGDLGTGTGFNFPLRVRAAATVARASKVTTIKTT
jgi:hypothetical protein